jgi:hypothetical protein
VVRDTSLVVQDTARASARSSPRRRDTTAVVETTKRSIAALVAS